MLARLLCVTALLLLPLAGRAAERGDFGAYHALIIGNNDYPHLPNLKTAKNDAVAVARLLRTRYGFETELLLNATRADILNALADLRATLRENDNLLIYYAGHGLLDEVSGEGYWLPVDAERQRPANWVSNNDITSQLKAMAARHVMVVADSCYASTLTRDADAGFRAGAESEEWLDRMVTKRSRTALTSGGLEPVLDAGGGGHSVFARAFLVALGDNNDIVDGQSLFDRVKGSVVANADQTPAYETIRKADDQGGDFVFVPIGIDLSVTGKIRSAPATPPTIVDERTLEFTFWEAIKDSSDPEGFETFLKQFPEGIFAGLARFKIKQLGEPGKGMSAPRPKEQDTAFVVPPKPPAETEKMAIKTNYDGEWLGDEFNMLGASVCSGLYRIKISVADGRATGIVDGPRAHCQFSGDIDPQGSVIFVGSCGVRATFRSTGEFSDAKGTGRTMIFVDELAEECGGTFAVTRGAEKVR